MILHQVCPEDFTPQEESPYITNLSSFTAELAHLCLLCFREYEQMQKERGERGEGQGEKKRRGECREELMLRG